MNLLLLFLILSFIVSVNCISTREIQEKQKEGKKTRKYVYNTKNKYCMNDSFYNENNDKINVDDTKIEEIQININENIPLLRKRI